MIRKLTETDRDITMIFLDDEKELNLFILGDIENYGMENDFQKIYGEFEDATLKSILLKYKNNLIYYAKEERNIDEYLELIETWDDVNMMSGKQEFAKRFSEELPHHNFKNLYFCVLNELTPLTDEFDDVIKLTDVEDLDSDYDLLSSIEEFESNKFRTREDHIKDGKRNIETGLRSYTYILKDGDRVISRAAITAETSTAGMIVGVCSDKNYRGKGLASKVLSKLCVDMTNEGKNPCLFYDNKKAGSLYHKLGFETIGMWSMFTLEK